MKKVFSLFTMAFVSMFALVLGVNAETVTTWDELKTCLTKAGSATCETSAAITAVAENITVIGDKTLILGDTLTIANRFKLDNGTKLIVKGNVTTTGSYMFMSEAGSTLKLEEGTFTSTARPSNSGNVAMLVSAFGSSTSGASKTHIEIGKNVEFINGGVSIYNDRANSGAAYGVVIDVYGKISMTKNGDINYNVFTINGNINKMTGDDLPTINFYDGSSVTNENAPAVYAAGYAIWNIYGGTFTGSEALSIKSGKFNITGGTFIANGKYVSPENVKAYNNGCEDTGAAISITGNEKYSKAVELNITNAKVSSKNGYAIFETTTSGTNPAVEDMNISGGDFVGEVGAVYVESAEDFITGGTYSSNIDNKYLVAETTQVDGVTYVGSAIEIGLEKVENGKVTLSHDKAIPGQPVKVTVEANKGYKLSKLVYVDGNDKEVEIKDGKFIMPNDEITVKATFVEDVKSPNTSDNGMLFMVLGLISLAGIAVTTNKLRHN